jgi:hypothetical protein
MNQTLGLSIDPDWVVYGIVAVVVVVGWIQNAVKQLKRPRPGRSPEEILLERRIGQLTQKKGPAGQAGHGPAGASNLDDLAARRRRQLQEMARRKGTGSPAGGAVTTTPSPLGSASADAAARGRSQQLQRAREMAQAKAQSRAHNHQAQRTSPHVSKTPARSSQPHQAARPTSATGASRQAAARAAAQRQKTTPRGPAHPSPRTAPGSAASRSRMRVNTIVLQEPEVEVTRQVANKIDSVVLGGASSTRRRTLPSGFSLRDAVVAKEILGKPLALRESLD